MARKPKQQTKTTPNVARSPATRWQIESRTHGVYVGSKYAERATNWPLFSWSPDPARIIRFDDKEGSRGRARRVQSFAACGRSTDCRVEFLELRAS
jgi:hypothetical protein